MLCCGQILLQVVVHTLLDQVSLEGLVDFDDAVHNFGQFWFCRLFLWVGLLRLCLVVISEHHDSLLWSHVLVARGRAAFLKVAITLPYSCLRLLSGLLTKVLVHLLHFLRQNVILNAFRD